MNLLIIELKRDEAVFATFHRKRGELNLVQAERHSFGEEGAFPQLVRDFAAKATGERRVILAIPAGQLFFREMELPISDRRKVRELLPLELKGETAVDTDHLVFDAIPLSQGNVLAVWAKRASIQELIAVLAENGLEPEIVTASLFNWQSLIPPEAETGTVAVTDGESLAVYRDKNPVFFRALGNGGGDELGRTLAAVEVGRGIKIERVFAHGGHARQGIPAAEGLHSGMVSQLPIAGEVAEAFSDDGDAGRDLAGAYAVARAVSTGDPVNFRTGDLAYTAGSAKLRKKLMLTMILTGTFVLLLFAEAGLRWYLVRKDVQSLDNSIRSIYRQVFPTRKKPVDEVAELKSEIRRLSSGKTSSNTLKIFKGLAEAKGDDVTGLYEAEIDGDQVRVKGDARNFQAVNDYKSRIGTFLTNVEAGETKSKPDGSVTFVLRGTVKEEGQ
jgi:general secretion pathway protein L